MTFVANRHVFWALSASKMHLQSYSAPPGPVAGEQGACSRTPSSLEFGPLGLTIAP